MTEPTTAAAPRCTEQQLVRPSITPDQRRDFRRWSEAINKLDDATKEEEGEAWIAAAMAILDRSNATAHVRAVASNVQQIVGNSGDQA